MKEYILNTIDNDVNALTLALGVSLLIHIIYSMSDMPEIICEGINILYSDINAINSDITNNINEIFPEFTKEYLEDPQKKARFDISRADYLSDLINTVFSDSTAVLSTYNDIISEYLSILSGSVTGTINTIQEYIVFPNLFVPNNEPEHRIPYHIERETIFGEIIESYVPTSRDPPIATNPTVALQPVLIPDRNINQDEILLTFPSLFMERGELMVEEGYVEYVVQFTNRIE
jgi:hypothetical protein